MSTDTNMQRSTSTYRPVVWVGIAAALAGIGFFVTNARTSQTEKPKGQAPSNGRTVYSVVPGQGGPIDFKNAEGAPLVISQGPYESDEPLDSTVIYEGGTGVAPTGGVIISADPRPGGLFTMAGSGVTLQVSGAGNSILTDARAGGSVSVSGSANRFAAKLEYTEQLTVTGAGNTAIGVKVNMMMAAVSQDPAAWGAGGPASQLYAANYLDVSSLCRNGAVSVSRSQASGKVVFSTCNIVVQTTGGDFATTVVSEGSVTLQGAGARITPVAAGVVALSTKTGVLSVGGAGLTLLGGLEALNGIIEIRGSGNALSCAMVANELSLAVPGTPFPPAPPTNKSSKQVDSYCVNLKVVRFRTTIGGY